MHTSIIVVLWGMPVKLQKLQNRDTCILDISKFIHRSETTTYNLRNTQMSLAMPQPRTKYAW